jgi:hypothetical protein
MLVLEAVVANKLVEVALVEVELVDWRLVIVSFVRVLSKTKPALPPESAAGVAAVVVQKGTRVAVSAEEVETLPEPPLALIVLHPNEPPDHVRAEEPAVLQVERLKPLIKAPNRLVLDAVVLNKLVVVAAVVVERVMLLKICAPVHVGVKV